jgi:glycosyltransferase involved in cell wall biosynthesis
VTTSGAVSTVIPTYNRCGLLPRAIASALAASRHCDEIIVIDDGSTDDTEHAVAPFLDRIRYIKVANGGPGRARNIGVAAARNPLVAFLDSDDEWMPDKLEIQRGIMAALPDVLYCFSDFAHKSGEVEHAYLINWHRDTRAWEQILGPGQKLSDLMPSASERADARVHVGDLGTAQMQKLYVFTSTLIVRRAQAGAALRFAEDIHIYEDWECYGRLSNAGPGAYLDIETVLQHDHEGVRLTGADPIDRVTARIKVLERVWGSKPEFLDRHGERYRAVMGEQQDLLVKLLIVAGRSEEARREMRRWAKVPLSYSLLVSMPPFLAQGLLSARSRLRRCAHVAFSRVWRSGGSVPAEMRAQPEFD